MNGIALIIIALCFMYVLLRLEQEKTFVHKLYMKNEMLNTRLFIAEEDIKELYKVAVPGSDRFPDDELEQGILRSVSLIERKGKEQ